MIALPLGCGGAWFLAFHLPWMTATVGLVAVSTIVMGVFTVSSQTLFQTAVPKAVVGRVVALQMTLAGVAAPAGAILGGRVGATIGVKAAMYSLGVGHIAVGAVFLLDGELRTLPAIADIDPTVVGLDAS